MSGDIIIKPFQQKGQERETKINDTIKNPLPKLNQHVLIASPTGAGKSTIVLNLLMNHLKFKWDRVIFFSKTWDYDIYNDFIHVDEEYIHKDYDDHKLMKIVDQQIAIQKEKNKPIFTLIVFDDFQDLFNKGSILENFLCHCRHWNITCWVLAQYVKAISKLSRQQFTCTLCFPSIANEEDLEVISETAPVGKKAFKKACNEVLSIIKQDHNVHHFLWINKKLEDKYYCDFNIKLDV